MYNHLIDFVHQFGFHKKRSICLALVHLIKKTVSSTDCNEITTGVFLDLSKAFDTLNHEILLSKLEHYGIRGLALQWKKSYFSYCKQFIQYNNTSSSLQTIKCGVPQGSILGPLFFLCLYCFEPN